jgi:hypothetical protein
VQAPQTIIEEWASLTGSHDPEQNLRSIAVLKDWVKRVEAHLLADGAPAASIEPTAGSG